MDKSEIIKNIEGWFKNSLGCSVGKREFSKGRYLFDVVYSKQDVLDTYNHFIRMLKINIV